MAGPMIDALEAEPDRWDTSALISVSSSAALFSQTVKDRFLELFPNLIITDSIGSTESGLQRPDLRRARATRPPPAARPSSAGRRRRRSSTRTLEADPRGRRPDRQARPGRQHPARLLQRPEEDRRDLRDRGRRQSATPCRATPPSGPATARSRCSVAARSSINSGGEKIFPEEVEQALKAHPAVFDCTRRRRARRALGPAGRRGRAVPRRHTAPRSTTSATTPATSRRATRSRASCTSSTTIVRSPSGKPDYPWAKQLAESGDRRVEA